jgi:hypothetical protein
MSPQIVTGARTLDTFDSLIRISFAYTLGSLEAGKYLVREGSDLRLGKRLALHKSGNLLVENLDILLVVLVSCHFD